MVGKPKPTKQQRLEEKIFVKDAIHKLRITQPAIAIFRDNSLCVFCYFLDKINTPRDDVHHAYGRATNLENLSRETYPYLVCTCRKCHPSAIRSPGGTVAKWVEEIIIRANYTPINPRFAHPENIKKNLRFPPF